MSSVFISYKRENVAKVQLLVQALRADGVEVWWDQDIAPDAPWEATIERELAAAQVAIVAWSQAAVASENVKAEARSARNAGKLIQVFVEKCDPPLFFGERQGVDLSDWNGDARDRRFQGVLAGARAILAGKRPPAGVGYTPKKRAPWAMLAALFVLVSAVLGFVSNLGGARDTVCSLAAINETCAQWGLVLPDAAPDAVESAAVARQRLLNSVAGRWGRQDRDCSESVVYAVRHDVDGFDRITVRGPNYESVGQVVAVENGAIVSRDTTPSPSGERAQWELRPIGDQLIVIDKNGVATTLVRCGAPP